MSDYPVILLVEDDLGDQELTRRALEDSPIQCELRIANDGEEALDYLHRRGRFAKEADSPAPQLVLLDLNIPGSTAGNSSSAFAPTSAFVDCRSLP